MGKKKATRPALVLRIENTIPNLSKSEQSVANYIIANPEKVIYQSVAALAENCGVSDPTVVRTCQKLGFTGYQSLKLAMAAAIVTPNQTVHEDISVDDNMQSISGKVFQSAVYALQFTKDTLDYEAMEAAVDALANARRIVILALGASGPVAQDLHHKLLRLGMEADVYTDSNLQAIACSYLDQRDVVFAISHSGSSKAVVDNASLAKKNGATVISLTSAGRSPLSKLANISLTTMSNETMYRIISVASRVAALTIVDCLYTYLAIRSEDAKSLKVEKNLQNLKY